MMKASTKAVFLLLLLPALLRAQYAGPAPFRHERGGLVINEISNGPSGSSIKEYIELIVTGAPENPGAPVDLEGWILDDNNYPASGNGNATGHLVFGPCYGAVPPGAILVIYNNLDRNPALPPDDPTDANNDGVYIIPHDHPCLRECSSNPSSASPLYCPCSDPNATPEGWQIGLRNPGDLVQIRDRCETVVQAIYWGDIQVVDEIANSPVGFRINMDNQSGRVIRFLNKQNDNWLDPGNYDNPAIGTSESPGAPNSPGNAAFIQAVRNGAMTGAGRISDCKDADAGDLLLPLDAPAQVSPLLLCSGDDVGPFRKTYQQPDEHAPDAPGFAFEYAFILTRNDAPVFSILDFNTSGDFDFRSFPPGEYYIWGFSYIQTNGSVSISQFLASAVQSVEDIRNFDACGFDGNIDHLDPDGRPVRVIIQSRPVVLAPAGPPVICTDANQATFDLSVYQEQINGGTGHPVVWYLDAAGQNPVNDPMHFTSPGTTVYASVTNGACESTPVAVPLTISPLPGISLEELEPVSCHEGSDGALRLHIENGNGPLVIEWEEPAWNGQTERRNLPAGTYRVTVTNAAGCREEAVATLLAPPAITLNCKVVQPVSKPNGSDGQAQVQFSGGGQPYVISWQGPAAGTSTMTGAGMLDLAGLPAGTYQVRLTDARGCTMECGFVITGPDCALNAVVEGTSPSCAGEADGSLNLRTVTGGTPPFEIALGAGSFSPLPGLPWEMEALPAGTYTLALRDANACIFQETIMLEEPKPLMLDLGPGLTIRQGQRIRLDVGADFMIAGFEWSPRNGLDDATRLTPVAAPEETTVYVLSAWDINGCLVDAQVTVTVLDQQRVFFPNVFSPNNDGINDTFIAFGNETVSRILTFRIFDRWGGLVYEGRNLLPNDPQQGWDGRRLGKHLDSGVYVYLAEIEFADGKTEIFKGDVMIAR